MDNNKISIIFFGSGDFPYPTFKTLVENELYDVKGLVTSPYKPYFQSETLKDVADRYDIPVYSTHNPNSKELVEWLKEKEADIFCVISYKFLSREILNIPKTTAFNVHASLLPFLRGAAPINWAIRYGFKITGLTSFVLDEHLDTGDIINNIKIPIQDTDDYGTLFKRLSMLCVGFTVETISKLREKNWRKNVIIQPECGIDSFYMKAPKLNERNVQLPIKYGEFYNIYKVYWHIQSLSPNIGTPCKLQVYKAIDNENINLGEYFQAKGINTVLYKEYNIKIYRVHLEEDEIISSKVKEIIDNPYYKYGNIFTDGKNFMTMKGMYNRYNNTATFLYIDEIQIIGKKKLPIKDFLAGFQVARAKEVYFTLTSED